MFIDEKDTCLLVEMALPRLPFLGVDDEFLTFDDLEQLKSKDDSPAAPAKHTPPEQWYARISAPLYESLVEVGHKQVFAALRIVAFHDRDDSPWGKATAELHDWVLAPEDADRSRPREAAAVAVLLATLYGEDGRFFLPATAA
ncbi:hypothetical protein [Streptomyces venezuelae]|uniref:hypothetical protein n=1 Tax=Streptomyces venezuelae TaxID=54571 RepID=UPI00331F52BC